MTIPVRACSCGHRMGTVTVSTDTHPAGHITHVCDHCDRKTVCPKPCAQCLTLTRADTHNRKT